MEPVQINWSTAEVVGREGNFDLAVQFRAPSPELWWESFTHALEQVSRETPGGRWQLIRGVDEPPAGLFVGGIAEESVTSLRLFLDTAVARANLEFDRTTRARREREVAEQRGQGAEQRTAERMTEAFRSGSAV